MIGNNNIYLQKTSKFSTLSLKCDGKASWKDHVLFVDLNCAYTLRLLLEELDKRNIRYIVGPGTGDDAVSPPKKCTFQFSEYERIDWGAVLSGNLRASSYCVRKGLSRKAQLAIHTQKFMTSPKTKHECKYLKDSIPLTIVIDTWPAFAVDTNALDNEARLSLKERMHGCLDEVRRMMESYSDYLWILKPSTINKGAGIQIVHCIEEVLEVVLELKDIREWVLQRYIDNPLLLRRRKFHIRAYAMAVSSIMVYLYNDVLLLCSGTKYTYDTSNSFAHITNTAYQSIDPNFSEEKCVLQLNDFERILLRDGTCQTEQKAKEVTTKILKDMKNITGELFSAYKGEFGVFAPIDGCFEHYGLDFVVDENYNVYLLEVNPGPDFKQTGSALCSVISGLMGDTIDVAICGESYIGTGFSKVYEHKMNNKQNISMKLSE